MFHLRRDDVPRGEEFTVHSLQFTVRIENALTANCRLQTSIASVAHDVKMTSIE